MERQAFYDHLKAFIIDEAEKRGINDASEVALAEDSNLFDIGLVNSFSMVSLLIHVEQMLGVSVDITDLDPETFFTMRGIYNCLAEKAPQ